VSATLPGISNGTSIRLNHAFTNATQNQIGLGTGRISLSATTTVYLVMRATFLSTADGLGYIGARRVR
jgi:hypothetical protein